MACRTTGPFALSLLALVLACSARPLPGDTQSTDDTQLADTNTTTSGATETETGSSSPGCEPILQADGTPTGYEQCMPNDFVVRVESATCSDPYPVHGPDGECSAGYGVCSYNSDCNEAAYGVCGFPADITAECHCEYGCMTDADCDPGFVCMCAPLYDGTHCIEADCRSDDDCDPGYHCALSPGEYSYGTRPSVRCHSAADDCFGDLDCPDGYCRWHDDHWRCW